MLNLIRMNNYRVRHMTCMYVLVIIVGLFCVFSVATISEGAKQVADGEAVYYENAVDAVIAGYNDAAIEAGHEEEVINIGVTVDENSERPADGDEAGGGISMTFGIYSEQPIRADGTVSSYLAYLYEDISSGILLIFIVIAVVLFFNREQNSGFIKNIASKSTSRMSIYFSKYASMILYMLLIFVVTAVGEYIALMVYYDGDLTFGKDIIGDFIAKMGVQFLLHIAFISGVIMVTTITRSSTMGITIGILANTGFSSLIVLAIGALFDFDITKYLINYNLTGVNLDSNGDVVSNAIIVGIITIIVYNIIGCTYFAKKDIA